MCTHTAIYTYIRPNTVGNVYNLETILGVVTPFPVTDGTHCLKQDLAGGEEGTGAVPESSETLPRSPVSRPALAQLLP